MQRGFEGGLGAKLELPRMLPRVVPLPHAGNLRRLLARVTPGGGRQAPGREVLLDHKVQNSPLDVVWMYLPIR